MPGLEAARARALDAAPPLSPVRPRARHLRFPPALPACQVIEAHYLFGVGYDDIDIVVHPQSIVHSAIETSDSSVSARPARQPQPGGARPSAAAARQRSERSLAQAPQRAAAPCCPAGDPTCSLLTPPRAPLASAIAGDCAAGLAGHAFAHPVRHVLAAPDQGRLRQRHRPEVRPGQRAGGRERGGARARALLACQPLSPAQHASAAAPAACRSGEAGLDDLQGARLRKVPVHPARIRRRAQGRHDDLRAQRGQRARKRALQGRPLRLFRHPKGARARPLPPL